jgi:hypothetical protein
MTEDPVNEKIFFPVEKLPWILSAEAGREVR